MKLVVNACRWICKGPFDLAEKMCLSRSTRLFWMNLFLLGKNLKTNMTSWQIHQLKLYFLSEMGAFPACHVSFLKCNLFQASSQLQSQVLVWEFLHIAQMILFSAQNVHPKTTGGVARQTRTFTHDWPWSRRRSPLFSAIKKGGFLILWVFFLGWHIILWSSSSLYIWQLLLPVANTSVYDPTRFQINIGNWKMREYY